MKELVSLKEMLENNIITPYEYEELLKRFLKSSKDYRKTWEDMIDDFEEYCKSEGYSNFTVKGYRTALYKFMRFITNCETNEEAYVKNFKTFDFADVNAFFDKMVESKYSKQAIHSQKHALVIFSNFLKSIGIESPDISELKIIGSLDNYKTSGNILSNSTINSMIESCELKGKVLLSLCYDGCIKRNDLTTLRFKDINLDTKQLILYKENGEIDRVCTLRQETVDYVKEYGVELYRKVEEWNANRISKGREPREDYGYIFQTVKSATPSYAILQTILKNSAKKYFLMQSDSVDGIDEKVATVTFESIRNSKKVYLLSQGYSVYDVMSYTGDTNYMSVYRMKKFVPIIYRK